MRKVRIHRQNVLAPRQLEGFFDRGAVARLGLSNDGRAGPFGLSGGFVDGPTIDHNDLEIDTEISTHPTHLSNHGCDIGFLVLGGNHDRQIQGLLPRRSGKDRRLLATDFSGRRDGCRKCGGRYGHGRSRLFDPGETNVYSDYRLAIALNSRPTSGHARGRTSGNAPTSNKCIGPVATSPVMATVPIVW